MKEGIKQRCVEGEREKPSLKRKTTSTNPDKGLRAEGTTCATLTVTASLASRLNGDKGMACQAGGWIPDHKAKDESTSSPLGTGA